MADDPKRHAFDVMVATSNSLLTLSSLLLTALAAFAAGLLGGEGPAGYLPLSIVSGGVFLLVSVICCLILFRAIQLANAGTPNIDNKQIRNSLLAIVWLFPIGVGFSVLYFLTV